MTDPMEPSTDPEAGPEPDPVEESAEAGVAPTSARLHGTCVSVDGRGALFLGASGSGKSATALAMIALGADLIADDQVELSLVEGQVVARCPEGFEGMIEARGIGLLRVPHARDIPVTLVIDMEQTELHRLPHGRKHEILGIPIDLVLGRDNWGLVSGVMALLRGGRA